MRNRAGIPRVSDNFDCFELSNYPSKNEVWWSNIVKFPTWVLKSLIIHLNENCHELYYIKMDQLFTDLPQSLSISEHKTLI